MLVWNGLVYHLTSCLDILQVEWEPYDEEGARRFQYIYYLQDRIFDLEKEISSGYKDDEQDDNNNGVVL